MVSLLALPIVFAAGWMIVKKYNTQTILFFAGIVMMAVGSVFHSHEAHPFLSDTIKDSGAIFVDFFVVIKSIASSTLAKLGLIIMAVGGFSKYMGHIGAAHAMVMVCTKPLSVFKNPYVILALAYVIGQLLNIFIPSAVGLALLLQVAMYPVLVNVGCSPAATAAVLATTACLDLGPASGASNKAAEVIGIDAASYFVEHQLFTGLIIMVVVAVLHFFCQQYFDKKDALLNKQSEFQDVDKEHHNVPLWFAILPCLPLILLLTFSKFAIDSVKVDVITAMFISLFVAMCADFIFCKDFKKVSDGMKVYLQGMGAVFASVVSLIIAAQTFVVGLKTIGFIDLLLHASSSLGFGFFAMLLVLIGLIGIITFLSGSGNAAFFSFSNLAPDVATHLGVATAAFALPMQLAAGIFRSFSPVSGVVIACAGVANISPIEIVKRTVIPMLGALITLLIITFIVN